MSKKAKTYIAIAAVVAILCLFPFPYVYSQTISMTKLDAAGGTLGHVDVTFQYRASRSLLFGKQIKQITVDEFDGHTGISSSRIADFQKDISDPSNEPMRYTGSIMAHNDGYQHYLGYELYLSPDCSRICIDAEYDDVQSYYLYSSSAADSTSDLIDYFDVRFE